MKYFLTFILGATVGALVTWKITKTKYEEIAQEEIDSVKEVFSKRYSSSEKKSVPSKNKEEKSEESVEVEAEVIDPTDDEKKEYANYAKMYTTENQVQEKRDKPYPITPEQFGEYDDYDTISLTYYSDEVLADDANEPIDDIDDVVGIDFVDYIGEYDAYVAYIRNDKYRCDYEITVDIREFYGGGSSD